MATALDMSGAKVDEVVVMTHPLVRRERKRPEEKAKPAEVELRGAAHAASEAVSAFEAKAKAEAARTAVGKQFGDRVKSANERFAAAVADNAKAKTSKLFTALDRAKAKVKEARSAFEEAATDDAGPVGKSWRARARLLDERAEAKAAAGEKVTKRAARLEAVMASIRAQAAQLRLDL